MFEYCYSLASVTIPDGVTSIGQAAFFGCKGLTSVFIPGSVTSIGDSAFCGCTSLTSVTIPASVTSIGYYTFGYCSALTEFTVADANQNYSSADGVLFNKDKTTLVTYPCGSQGTSYTIPNSVTSISDRAFNACTNLTSVTIPASLTSISDSAFKDCTSLQSVAISEGVESIGKHAFEGCKGLTSVTIHGSVTSIDIWAFKDCTSLNVIRFDPSCNFLEFDSDSFAYDTNIAEVWDFPGTYDERKYITDYSPNAKFLYTTEASGEIEGDFVGSSWSGIASKRARLQILKSLFSELPQSVQDQLSAYSECLVFDISMFDGDKKIQPDGTIKIKLKIQNPLNEELIKNLKIFHIKNDDSLEEVSVSREGDFLIFSANSFSKFAFVRTSSTLSTGDSSNLYISGLGIVMMTTVGFWLFILYRKNKA